MKRETIQITIPKELLSQIRQAAIKTGLSIADMTIQSMNLGLDKLVQELEPQGRITNVDPLPDDVLQRVYSLPERDETGIELIITSQATQGRE